MKILVTGGMGFMGSNFIRHLLKKYKTYRIINLDRLTYAGNPDNLKDIKTPRYQFIKGDITNPKIVNQLVKRVDVVINYAAETHVDRSILEPDAFIKTDIIGVYNLLEACKNFGIKKYIQVGTDEVYGSVKYGAAKEEAPFKPNSPYSASKAGADHLLRAYFVTFALPAIRTNACNNYGPYQYPEKLIPLFITNLLENKKIPLYGRGNQIREWIYVLDHCRAIDFLMHRGKVGEAYNIGTGERKKNIEVTLTILKELGEEKEMIEYVKDRAGHDLRYALNSEKLKKLGWKPLVRFEEGIKKTVKWYKENKDWWRRIKSGDYKKYYKKQYRKK